MFKGELAHIEHQNLLRRLRVVADQDGSSATLDGRRVILLCSNDYLGLARHPSLEQAACAAMQQYGFGSGASRLVSGNSPLHQELEERIALFKGTEAALLFNTGYAANTGIIPAVAGAGDVILSDSLNHASIIDGCRMSRATVQVYRHRDRDHVEDLLKKNASARRTLIVTDGVFSMDGDIAPLPDLARLAEQYGALLMVDDAHATGVLGKDGKGTVEHFNLEGRVHIQMGTLGKALGSFGAYVAGSRALIDYLVNSVRSFIFSTALPPAVCAASMAAIDLVKQEPERRDALWNVRNRLAAGLRSIGIDTNGSETPIIPIMIGDARGSASVSALLLEAGIFAPAIRPPTVPKGTSRIRTTVTALHTAAAIDAVVSAFTRLKQEGHIPDGPDKG
jgi:8-amino-7-oxononanoate synthase